ncbi:MAG: RimK/LysX family protein [Yoonia sp.]|nr:RimK/LysX family protein [Yoonia sp.]
MVDKITKPKPPLLVIGWIEHLDLPDLGLARIKAKIDTGARTSALHATHITPFQKDGAEWVRFEVPIDDETAPILVQAPIYDRRDIKNTSGIPETRIIIRTRLKLTDRTWMITVSLSDRSNMRFPMIVGRTALKKHNIAVHTRRANLTA